MTYVIIFKCHTPKNKAFKYIMSLTMGGNQTTNLFKKKQQQKTNTLYDLYCVWFSLNGMMFCAVSSVKKEG